ncbi:hypothetical protein BE21_19910 [Sorangium cellulosum]|uniref:Type IV secretion protein Rhs n=1 Tax=Sorangium cellulosum TaxID=56 RepID=A0A150TWH2_SORCE|nr:hypothetical protein BE21_19910 [Sorangium cellulosum]
MLASSFFDLVLGIDIHWELVPMPAPVPTPIPNPFTGIVFDPMGLVAGLAIGNAIGMVMGASFQGPVVYWTAVPATNTGTDAKHIPGHILIPPGTGWAPMPKTPKPTIHPGETPSPPKPVVPDNDAVVITGSKTVHVGGSNAARMGDMLLSCSEPVRLPSSVVLAVPKGAPILIGGPPALDLQAAITASLRTRFISDSLHALVSRMKPSRFRNFLHRTACFFTGHPVDVASGKVMTEAVDSELSGPLPFKIERVYSSAFAGRAGPLGHGWSLSLDQAVWEERGKVVYLAEDGREIEFDTFELPGHQMPEGSELWHPVDRLTLRRGSGGQWEITRADGVRHEFSPVPGCADGRASIRRLVSACGSHDILFEYDNRGCLEWVRDSAGRLTGMEHDAHGRIVALKLPAPSERGWYTHRRYRYNTEGDLVEVVDSLGESWRFEYETHLLVRESDRTGLSFYFQYDGTGEDASCVRTWGDGGIFDHLITYDKAGRVTYVNNSLGETTRYFMNTVGLVTKVVEPLGGETTWEYDSQTLQPVQVVDPLGRVQRVRLDTLGRVEAVVWPSGTVVQVARDEGARTIQVTDASGAKWWCQLDDAGRPREQIDPEGRRSRWDWHQGRLARVTDVEGRATELEYDERSEVSSLQTTGGAKVWFGNDRLGRMLWARGPKGGELTRAYDSERRLTRQTNPSGLAQRLEYDPEGNLLSIDDHIRRVRFHYGNFHRVVAREEAGSVTRLEYDSEGRVVSAVNEEGRRHKFEYDANGHLAREVGSDGREVRYVRDAAGQLIAKCTGGGRVTRFSYDADGNVLSAEDTDGGRMELVYSADGRIMRAKNQDAEVVFERDALGRVVAEHQRVGEGDWAVVRGRYASGFSRDLVESSLGARMAVLRDREGRVESMVFGRPEAWNQSAIRIERDALGSEVARHLPGGATVRWTRDAVGRPLERTLESTKEGGAARSSGRSYHWRGESFIDQIIDSDDGPVFFDRDERGRVIQQRYLGRTIARSMDVVGNVYRSRDGGDRRYEAGCRLVDLAGRRFLHDADGNLIEREDLDGKTWRYHWNDAGLLREVVRPDGTVVRMLYDAFGRRVAKRLVRSAQDDEVLSETRFVWDGERVLHEMRSGHEPTTWYSDPDSFAIVAKEQGGKRWTVGSDQIGTPGELVDDRGRVVWRMRLDIWGVASVDAGSRDDCPWRWPGQYEDTETGWYYNRFRHYSPEAGSYVSPDPLGLFGGLHPYAYVDDPLWAFDALGLSQCTPEPQRPILVDNSFLVRALEGDETARRILRASRGHSFIDFTQMNEFLNVRTGRRARQRFFRQTGIQQLDPLQSSRLLRSREGQEVFQRLTGACEPADATMAAIGRAGGYNVVTADGRLYNTVTDTFGRASRAWGLRISLLAD